MADRETRGGPSSPPKGARKPRVCFVALHAYGLLSGRDDLCAFGGGAERQITLIAPELAARGYPVSLVTLDHGQPDGIVHQGVTVYRAYRAEAGVPGVRFVHPRMTGLWRALTRANADVCIQRCGDSDTGVVAAWCRRRGRRFVFSSASDADCDGELRGLESRRERALYRFGLSRAHHVLVQTERQRRLLWDHWGIHGRVVRSCAPRRDLVAFNPSNSARARARILWVGRFTRNKRLEVFLEAAQHCPALRFEVVGSPYRDTGYTEGLKRLAERMDNVVMRGFIAPRDIDQAYEEAAIMCCTSRWEGFPNTFLEAWSRGIPVVTTVDPDDVVAENGLGRVVGDAPGLATAIRELVSNQEEWLRCSEHVRAYFRAHYSIAAAANGYEAILANKARSG